VTVSVPLVYLDQNILSEIAKGGFCDLFDKIRSGNMQLVYSHAHIKETAHSNNQNFQDKVIQAITAMNGAYLHEGQLHFDKSPRLRLDEYLANPEVYSQISGSMAQLAHKFFGGQQGKNFPALINGQRDTFETLISHMRKNMETLNENEDEEIRRHLPMLKMLPELIRQEFEKAAPKLSKTLEASIPASETFNGAKEFRSAVDVAPSTLNNIRPPNVMQKIWAQVVSSGKMPAHLNNVNDFLSNGVWARINNGDPSWEAKVGSLYTLLNMFGYWPDDKLHKDDGFRSAMGDQTHSALAAYTHMLVTCDESMAKKTYAIYEHLGIERIICWYKNDGNGRFNPLIGEGMFC